MSGRQAVGGGEQLTANSNTFGSLREQDVAGGGGRGDDEKADLGQEEVLEERWRREAEGQLEATIGGGEKGTGGGRARKGAKRMAEMKGETRETFEGKCKCEWTTSSMQEGAGGWGGIPQ